MSCRPWSVLPQREPHLPAVLDEAVLVGEEGPVIVRAIVFVRLSGRDGDVEHGAPPGLGGAVGEAQGLGAECSREPGGLIRAGLAEDALAVVAGLGQPQLALFVAERCQIAAV